VGRSRIANVSREAHSRSLIPAQTLAANVLREHRFILSISAAYVAGGGVLLGYLGQPWPLRVAALPFLAIWLVGAACWLGAAFLASPQRLRACVQPERVLGAAIVGLLAVPVQTTFQSLKQAIGVVIGFPWDSRLDRWDQAIHGGTAWHWFSGLIAHEGAIRTIDLLYVLWFAEVLVIVVWASWTPHRVLRQRAMVAMLLLWVVGGTIAAAMTASAGPCFVTLADYGELLRRLDRYTPPLLARVNESGIWKLHDQGVWGPLAGISAMPSMHVGFAALATCVAWSRSRVLGGLAALYAVAIQIGSVALAWHYAIDGYAGALCAWGCWQLARFASKLQVDPISGRDR